MSKSMKILGQFVGIALAFYALAWFLTIGCLFGSIAQDCRANMMGQVVYQSVNIVR